MPPFDKDALVERLLSQSHLSGPLGPSIQVAQRFLQRTLALLFPQLRSEEVRNQLNMPDDTVCSPISDPHSSSTHESGANGTTTPAARKNERAQCAMQLEEIERDLLNVLLPIGAQLPERPAEISSRFLVSLPELRTLMITDANAILEGDPAAKSLDEVVLSYPGFFATATHRIAHFFEQSHIPLLPRILSEFAHEKTGIDIHPGASIGESFCIDHGTGIVIGETSVLGSHVKLYQGVTLGALSVEKSLAKSKRHPTIEHHVVVYSNATILGGDTVIGHHATIGGNVWLTDSVPPHSTVYHRGDVILKEGPGSASSAKKG